jgi:Fe-S-cluster containining protein
MPFKKFKCRRCGNCCKTIGADMDVENSDIQRWLDKEAWDILQWVDVITIDGNRIHGDDWMLHLGENVNEINPVMADVWISPKTGDVAGRCPFLRKVVHEDIYECSIEDMKPVACKAFPTSRKHGENHCPECK